MRVFGRIEQAVLADPMPGACERSPHEPAPALTHAAGERNHRAVSEQVARDVILRGVRQERGALPEAAMRKRIVQYWDTLT